MPHGEHTAMDYYPRRLYQAEIQNLYTVFHFFSTLVHFRTLLAK